MFPTCTSPVANLLRKFVAHAVLAVLLVCTSMAWAGSEGKTIHWVHVEGSIIYSVQEFPEGDWWYVIYDAENDAIIHAEEITGNPSPDGTDSGLVSEDAVELGAERLAKDGASMEAEIDPWKTPLGLYLLDQGIGPVPVTDPWDDDWLSQPGDGGGGQGGFDPGVPFDELIPNHRGSDDNDNSDTEKPDDLEFWDVDPEVIDPSPEELQLLLLLMEFDETR